MSEQDNLPACPVEITLQLLGNKWKVMILRDLFEGPRRFSELKSSVGTISAKVLTTNLRSMEADHLLKRTIYPEVPPRVEYELTELGQTLRPVVAAMKKWGKAYRAKCSDAA